MTAWQALEQSTKYVMHLSMKHGEEGYARIDFDTLRPYYAAINTAVLAQDTAATQAACRSLWAAIEVMTQGEE